MEGQRQKGQIERKKQRGETGEQRGRDRGKIHEERQRERDRWEWACGGMWLSCVCVWVSCMCMSAKGNWRVKGNQERDRARSSKGKQEREKARSANAKARNLRPKKECKSTNTKGSAREREGPKKTRVQLWN